MRIFKTHKNLVVNLLISLIVTVSLTFNRIIKVVDFVCAKVIHSKGFIKRKSNFLCSFYVIFLFFSTTKNKFPSGKK